MKLNELIPPLFQPISTALTISLRGKKKRLDKLKNGGLENVGKCKNEA
jgi:hypothetical protein